MWSKTVFRVIPEIEENPQMPVCQGVPVFWLLPVGWMPIRSQTRRDTNFAIPGYSISAMIPRRGVKIKFFLSVVNPVVKAAFVPFSATGESPANAGVARLCGVSPHPIPDTATALPKTRRDTNFAIPGYPRAALSRRPLIVPYFPPGRKVEAKLFSIQASHLREKPRLRPPPPPGGRP